MSINLLHFLLSFLLPWQKYFLEMMLISFLLGFTAFRNAYFGSGTIPILLDNLLCLGTETQLASCTHSGVGNIGSCSHSEDAGVRCKKRELLFSLSLSSLSLSLSFSLSLSLSLSLSPLSLSLSLSLCSKTFPPISYLSLCLLLIQLYSQHFLVLLGQYQPQSSMTPH